MPTTIDGSQIRSLQGALSVLLNLKSLLRVDTRAFDVTDIRRVYSMKTFEGLLERSAQLIEQSRLTRIYGVATTRWSFDHPKKGIRGRIGFERVV